ncbi:MAG: peptidoglycan editing factor PgeF [Candidatus Aminicenantaceae bacterium]
MQTAKTIQAPELSRLKFLCHGFGNRFFDLKQLKTRSKGFQYVFLRQIHSDIIIRLETVPDKPPAGDACITPVPGLMLLVQTADCLPVLLVDPVRRVIGAAHCGWKGTALGLAAKLAGRMEDEFGSRKENLMAALGPCIGARCYQVGEEVREAFQANGQGESGFVSAGDTLFLDLKKANRDQLVNTGVTCIFSLEGCTFSQPDMYSYRRNGSSAGRMLSFIGMRERGID